MDVWQTTMFSHWVQVEKKHLCLSKWASSDDINGWERQKQTRQRIYSTREMRESLLIDSCYVCHILISTHSKDKHMTKSEIVYWYMHPLLW
jgi:hypothetical protein